MATTQTSPRESAPHSSDASRDTAARRAPTRPNRAPTDDEILGLDSASSSVGARQEGPPGRRLVEPGGSGVPGEDTWRDAAHPATASDGKANVECGGLPAGEAGLPPLSHSEEAKTAISRASDSAPESDNLRAAFDANPELRQAWHDAHSYRESFATPGEARAATALLADLDRLDALFFSRRPEDHAELARSVAALDPDAFASLARAMSAQAGSAGFEPANFRSDAGNENRRQNAGDTNTSVASTVSPVGVQSASPSWRMPGADAWQNEPHSAAAHSSTDVSSRARPTASSLQSADEARLPARQGSAFASANENQQQIPRSARNDSSRVVRSSVEAQGFSPAKNDGLETPPSLPPRAESAVGGRSEAVAELPAERHSSAPSPAQIEFFHSANAAAVRNVLDAIESQVERLLPDGVSKSARNRVVGEIYRELDSTLQSNRQLTQQMRDAFRSGSLDANHQRAIVSLITGRARQALPGVAKRVLSEWTSTIVAANHDRRTRQRAAESRVDIAGSSRSGHDSIRPMSPRDIDYARLSDSDILNM